MPKPIPTVELLREDDGACRLLLSGDWLMHAEIPDFGDWEAKIIEKGVPSRMILQGDGVGSWNTGLLLFITRCMDWCRDKGIACHTDSLPKGPRQLIRLTTSVAEKKGAHEEPVRSGFLETVGNQTLDFYRGAIEILRFLGECVLGFLRLIRGQARLPWSDLALIIQQCGADALPIVSLISFLVGLILAFVGGMQLAYFGATLYTADLVSIAMTREMGAMMTGIIMCGRTGAAFAAQLGSMKVTEEIDALKVLGISPIDFLVLPRMIALMVMMPLLCVFADLVGIIGGLVVGMGLMDLGFTQYYQHTLGAVQPIDFVFGIFKGSCFGALVAASGCLRGIQCGDSSEEVGLAATSAVVTGITSIIIADALFAVIANRLGI